MTVNTFNASDFASPSAAWRGKPFWSWNGRLEKDELIRQIHVLKEMGMGGYFMHSRTGLVTEYLGEEWFELTNACAEEGERLGMESWLYDEDRWPSGTAGGMVTANPDFRMQFIHLATFAGEEFDLAAWEEEQDHPLGAWSCRLENEIDIFDVAPVTENTPSGELAGKTMLTFRIIPMAGGPFYNGNTYVDTMKREATDEYIRVTHEAYKQHCGQHFGKSIKGIFTDEPHRGGFMSGFGFTGNEGVDLTCMIPWTETIFETFAETHGIRVEDNLPALFLRQNGREVTQLKAQYAETMLSLFVNNFAKPYYDWCEANDLLVTGHVLHENSLSCQVSTNGSVQRYYPHMHVPGIDYLCEHGREYWVAKQVDSTARQFNQSWILSELYGCTGWQMNFEAHKAIGAWQALFGVNLRCHHLSWYTMGGEAKRDYPASILHQSPWHTEYGTVETWFARLGYFRAQGDPCCDLLVLNPVESVWGRVYPGAITGMNARDEGIKKLEKYYAKLFHILAGNQIDFDYGDEALLAEHGAVSAENDRPALSLGAMRYSTVLVAGADTLRGTTLALLKQFVDAGGTVIFAGDAPRYVDSLPSSDVVEFAGSANSCAFEETAVVQALAGHTQKRVEIIDTASGEVARDVFCQLRSSGDDHYLTILNTSRDESHDVTISLAGVPGNVVEEWDLDTGRAISIPDSGLRLPRIRRGRPTSPHKAGQADFRLLTTTLHTSQARCFRIVTESQTIADSAISTPPPTSCRPSPRRSGAMPRLAGGWSERLVSSATPQPQEQSGALPTQGRQGQGKTIRLDQSAAYSLAEKNICVLDMPAWTLGESEGGPVNDILRVDRELRQQLGVPLRAGTMVQPWFRGKEAFPALGKLTLRYPIRVASGLLDAPTEKQNTRCKIHETANSTHDSRLTTHNSSNPPSSDYGVTGRRDMPTNHSPSNHSTIEPFNHPPSEMELVLETPQRFSVAINGTTIDTSHDKGWWVDIAFRRITIPAGLLHAGDNELIITCDFSEDLNLEAIYLLGDFAVTMDDTTPILAPLPETLTPTSIVEQGFPYYSDSIIYHYPVPNDLIGRETLVKVPSYEGAYLKLSSGDQSEMIPWRPNEARLRLADTLNVEICITRKNTFGPLHLKDPVPSGTGPHSFVPAEEQFSLEPVFIPSGLLAPVELSLGQGGAPGLS